MGAPQENAAIDFLNLPLFASRTPVRKASYESNNGFPQYGFNYTRPPVLPATVASCTVCGLGLRSRSHSAAVGTDRSKAAGDPKGWIDFREAREVHEPFSLRPLLFVRHLLALRLVA
jgi:hypothetical protein